MILDRCLLLAICGALACLGQGLSPAMAQSFVQSAKCGVFYDKWNVPGAPAGTLATVGMAHESFAARDCLSRKNTPMACEHYRKALGALDRMGPTQAAELGPGIKAKMAEAGCR
ncbi:MAG: hypothetical protein GEU91_09815 [Rhizobiales bacterium]|nr:hypothetical protein [Hyphomicrobiales bacterium]